MSRLATVAAALGLALSTCTVHADGGADEQLVAMLVEVGGEDQADPLIRAASSQLSDLGVVLRLHPEPELPQGIVARVGVAARVARQYEAVAVFWQDPGPAGRLNVFYLRDDVARILTREVESPEVGEPSEAVAIMVRQTVAEILAGEVIGEEAPLPGDEPVAVEPPVEDDGQPAAEDSPDQAQATEPSFHRLELALGYTLQAQAAEPLLLHGIAVGLGWRFHPNLALIGGYRFAWPSRVEDDAATIKVSRHPAHLGLRAWFELGRFRLGGAAALVVDYVTVATPELSQSLERISDDGDLGLATTVDFVAVLMLADWLGLAVSIGAEIPLKRKFYYIPGPEGADDRRVLFDPWPAQPRVVVGLLAEFL
jgi:hypothetical protein